MNDFTINDLKRILEAIEYTYKSMDADWPDTLMMKISNMIETKHTSALAASHLKQAESLISHARCLLGMDE